MNKLLSVLTIDHQKHYTQRAEGGCGLILSEGALINQQGTEWPNAPGIWSEEHVAGWKRITDGVHEAGGKIFCQVSEVYRQETHNSTFFFFFLALVVAFRPSIASRHARAKEGWHCT